MPLSGLLSGRGRKAVLIAGILPLWNWRGAVPPSHPAKGRKAFGNLHLVLCPAARTTLAIRSCARKAPGGSNSEVATSAKCRWSRSYRCLADVGVVPSDFRPPEASTTSGRPLRAITGRRCIWSVWDPPLGWRAAPNTPRVGHEAGSLVVIPQAARHQIRVSKGLSAFGGERFGEGQSPAPTPPAQPLYSRNTRDGVTTTPFERPFAAKVSIRVA